MQRAHTTRLRRVILAYHSVCFGDGVLRNHVCRHERGGRKNLHSSLNVRQIMRAVSSSIRYKIKRCYGGRADAKPLWSNSLGRQYGNSAPDNC